MAEQNLTVEQVAARINYSPAQVRSLLRNEKLKGTRAGERGKWQITTESVDKFVGTKTDETQSTETPATDPPPPETPKTEIKPPVPKTKEPPPDPPAQVTTPPESKRSNFPLGEAIKRLFR